MSSLLVFTGLVGCLTFGCGEENPAPAPSSEDLDAQVQGDPDGGQQPDNDGSPQPENDTGPTVTDAQLAPDADAQMNPNADTGTPPDTDAGIQPDPDAEVALPDPDLNEDGELNILIIGTTRSLEEQGEAFAPDLYATALQNILVGDAQLDLEVNVVAEDVYRTQTITTGYGQRGDDYEWPYHCHSLTQYYFWPDEREARLANLRGEGEHDWDYVVMAGDPHIISTLPGYFALGVNKVANAVTQGDAQPLLLMAWPRDDNAESMAHFAEFTRRTSHGARAALPLIPAGIAWSELSAEKKDNAGIHPTPNGAYTAAAAIYSQVMGRSASASEYTYDDEIAEAVHGAVSAETTMEYDFGTRNFVSAFQGGGISDRVLNFNHTGTSSERGILGGLRWVLGQANVRLENGGEAPINFNYGRANTEFEANKRYRVAPDEFEFSVGFPMQDNSDNGNTSMLYGLDKRRHNAENGTDLGVARHMAREGELPHARAVPIRTLFVQMKELIPAQSAYADGWHMNHDLDKATGAFMYTLLTGHCALPDEPENRDSGEWRSWVGHKTGYETAWQFMHLSARAPCFRVLPESADSISLSPDGVEQLFISFGAAPSADVTVTLSSNNDDGASYEPAQLVFTAENYNVPQTVQLMRRAGDPVADAVTITATTQSVDRAFDELSDRWTYTLSP